MFEYENSKQQSTKALSSTINTIEHTPGFSDGFDIDDIGINIFKHNV